VGAEDVTLTTLVMAVDEEIHLERAVGSALALGPVIVVDGGSTDRTDEVARSAGAKVIEHPWQGYAAQKNWALDHAAETDWILFLDADEWVTENLRAEIETVVAAGEHDGFYIPRRNVFLGRMLRHAWWYPDYQLRLFRRDKGRYENRLVHEHVLLEGEPGFLEQPLMHENLKGLDEFILRHLRYAELEAAEILKARRGANIGQRKGSLFGSWPERRRMLKLNVWYRIPARPAVRFLWMYLVRRGFLDGREGRVYCQLLATYEAMINAKLVELERKVDSRV
jgi:glycosyltransferase involved in cell wall biosynthesis